jgi:hypothetical protein
VKGACAVLDRYREYRETFSAPVFAGHRISHTDEKQTFHIHFRPFADPFLLLLSGEDAGELIALYENLIAVTGNAGLKGNFGRDLQAKFILGILLIKVNALYRQAHDITTDSIGRDCSRIKETGLTRSFDEANGR